MNRPKRTLLYDGPRLRVMSTNTDHSAILLYRMGAGGRIIHTTVITEEELPEIVAALTARLERSVERAIG